MMNLKKFHISAIFAVILAILMMFGVVLQTACILPDTTVKHTVTFHLGGGSLPGGSKLEFEENKEVILPQDATRNGYTFEGWYDNSELTGESYTKIKASEATADKEFWAKWVADNSDVQGGEDNPQTPQTPVDPPTPKEYTVRLHLNSGKFKSGFSDITSYTSGTAVTLPQVERDGYKFCGWYTSSVFSGDPVEEIPANATGNKDYYAKWEPNSDPGGDHEEPTVYTVTFDLNYDGAATETKQVTSGDKVPDPGEKSRIGYDFLGWFTGKNDGTKYNFTEGVTSSFTLYAHWRAKTYTVTFETYGGKINNGNIPSYTYGTVTKLPTDVTKDGNDFGGWFENENYTGNAVTEISATSTGNKTFYAKWTPVTPGPTDELTISAHGGYEEGAYIECGLIDGATAADYSVTYSGNGVSETKIDAQLIRVIEGKVRADIVGLKAGLYTVKVSAKGKSASASVTATKNDRSGYAHFMYDEGVGAYNDDGTLKDGAVVVYVTEETKNTVTQKIGSKTYNGIVDILMHASDSKVPLVVRVLGTIGAATWNEINYDKGGNFNDGKDYDGNNHLPASKVIGKNNKQLPTDSSKLTQAELINGGYNTLDTSVYSELKGLNSKATYKDGEYDSAWNNCSISGASNVTVEGVGTDARIFQWGFTWAKCNSIEVRNLTFEDYTEDACSFEGGSDQTDATKFDSQHIWVHNNTFLEGKNYWDVCPEQDKHEGDGATDFKKNSYITIAYNHYFKNHKTGLIGGGDTQKTACVTFHHNWYEDCNSRLPLARQANMHMYNNYYDGSTGTNMSIRAGGYAFIEYCYFDNANTPIETKEGDSKKGVAKVYQCVFNGKKVSSTYLGKTVIEVTDRTQAVSNDNIFNKSFDTDDTYFYYDQATESTKLDAGFTMLTAEQVKVNVPKLAGVHTNK